MTQRFNVISPRPKRDGGTFWHRIGTAFPRQDGGFQVILDSLPLPDAEGRVTMLISPSQEQDGGSRPQRQPTQQPTRQAAPVDDEVPF